MKAFYESTAGDPGQARDWDRYRSLFVPDARLVAARPGEAGTSGTFYLMVSDWPGRKVKAEPQIVLGYPVKQNAPAAVAIGAAKFNFFARGSGSAWLQSLGENARLIEAMGKGVSAVASGVSARGTKTSDTYSLAGFGDAIAKIHDVCKM